MATLDGYTADAIDTMLDTLLSSLTLEENGQLIATKRDGETINVGVIAPTKTAVAAAWPVGSIFMNTSPTNPKDLLGGVGTWVRWGMGRVPVSQDPNQTEFDVSEETGGEKTHKQTVAELPSHDHNATTEPAGAHSHTLTYGSTTGSSNYLGRGGSSASGTSRAAITDSNDHSHTIDAQGGGTAFNILQPYIVVYMWRRSA